MKKKFLIITSILCSVILWGCAGGKESSPDPDSIAAFEGDEESVYYMQSDDLGGSVNITEYVYSCKADEPRVRADLLTDYFGFTLYEREEEEEEETSEEGSETPEMEFIEYKSPDGDLLQIQLDGNYLMYKGVTHTMPDKNEIKNGSLILTFTNTMFALGYDEIFTAKEGNQLTFALRTAEDIVNE